MSAAPESGHLSPARASPTDRGIATPLLLSALLGALTPLGYAPFYWSVVPILTLAGLISLLASARSKLQAAGLGFAFGLGKFGVGVSWVYVSLHDFGNMPAPLAAFATLLFVVALALFPAIACALARTPRRRAATQALLTFPAWWALLEWLRGWIFTGFPWLAIGYSQVPAGPLVGLAPLIGIYGVSGALGMTAGAVSLLLSGFARFGGTFQRGRFAVLAAVASVALLIAVSRWSLERPWTRPSATVTSVSLLQGNVAQDIKWRPESAVRTLELYAQLVFASNSALTIMPETALPMFLEEVPAEYLQSLAEHVRAHKGDLVIGVPESTAPNVYYNSVVSIGASSTQTYRKVHLVPFSEFIPFKWLIGWIYDDLLHMPLADFTAGDLQQTTMDVAGQKIAVTNCYEDLFGEALARRAANATLLVNVSNDAWFGRSLGPQQHLQISQMRALETGRFMLRATNTGVTAVIDQRGRVLSRAPEFTTTSLEAKVPGYVGVTPYVRGGNAAFLVLACSMIAAALLFTRTASPPATA